MALNRRDFLVLGASAAVAAAASVNASTEGASVATVAKSERLWISVSTLDLTTRLDELFVEPTDGKYQVQRIESPTRGQLIVKLVPAKSGFIHVSIFRPGENGKYELCHSSFAGLPLTTLHIPDAGIALTIGSI